MSLFDKTKAGFLKLKYILFFLFTASIVGAVVVQRQFPNAIGALFSPVSVVSKVIGDGNIQRTDGRTNILLLGVDRRSANSTVSHVLTDTILVISVDERGQNPVVISLPRDLWIPSAQYKINAIYSVSDIAYSKNPAENPPAAEVASGLVAEILGIPIHYYAVVGFDAFTDAVDAVDGIEVDVKQSFDDYLYPIEGKENYPVESERYMHLRFEKGLQHMDGERALQFARSRHAVEFSEQGDFARARRQQQVILALKNKVLSSATLMNPSKIRGLYDAYANNVETNVSLGETLLFYDQYKDINIGEISQIVLSNEPYNEDLPGSGVLVAPSEEDRLLLYKGQYVLVPRNKTYDPIHVLIRKQLFE